MTGRPDDDREDRQPDDLPDRPVVAQVLGSYPYKGQQYVYDLIFNLKKTRSAILARRHLQPKRHLDHSKWKAESVSSPWKSRLIAGAVNRLSPNLGDDIYSRFVARESMALGAKIIHVHYGVLATRVIKSGKRFDLPLIVSLYGSGWRAVSPEWNARYRRFFEICDRVIVECDATADMALKGGCPPDKLRRVHLGIDTDGEFPYVQRSPGRTTRFLIVARFIAKKGYPHLLEAFARLAGENPHVSLTAVGYGELKDWIGQRARELGVADKVQVVDTTIVEDFTTTLREALASHDVFLYPSVIDAAGDHEGTAVCLMAAQASGLPTIATPVGGNEEVIREGGVLVPPGNEMALAEQMVRLAGEAGYRLELGTSARRYAVREFSLDRQVDRLEEVYSEFL